MVLWRCFCISGNGSQKELFEGALSTYQQAIFLLLQLLAEWLYWL